eukprot:9495051-Alexandrium_andersonii.AAC.1
MSRARGCSGMLPQEGPQDSAAYKCCIANLLHSGDCDGYCRSLCPDPLPLALHIALWGLLAAFGASSPGGRKEKSG